MPTLLNDREFELINLIGENPDLNQRRIANQLHLSLGMVNRLIRRLVGNGCLYLEQVDRRKVRYYLTPQGRTQQHHKSIQRTWWSIRFIGRLKHRLKDMILKLYAKGERRLFIWGDADCVALAELALRELRLDDCAFNKLDTLPDFPVEGPILLCREEASPALPIGNRYIHLIEEANVLDVSEPDVFQVAEEDDRDKVLAY